MSTLEAAAVEFAVEPVDQVLDLVGDPAHHGLALFMHGNQWMLMPELLRAFQQAQPEAPEVFYETLPPQVLVQQVRRGALRLGALLIRVAADVLTLGLDALDELAAEGWLREYHPYATNRLAILVWQGNPKGIRGWSDLLLEDVRVALPDPETEGIGRLVREAVIEALGPDAWTELAHRKRERGTAILTQIHHRQTPLLLLAGRVDAGPVWLTESLYQERSGAPLATVRLPEDQNRRSRYGVALLERCPHPEAARAFVDFLRGPVARETYHAYGFEAPAEGD